MPAKTVQLIRPARNVAGALRLPGDKSISHRYAMLAALAKGKTRLENFSSGADCASTLNCLRELGAKIEKPSEGIVEIEGGRFRPPSMTLDCGNSGSTMRMLAGLLAAQPFASELTGDASLRRRPMARILEPLNRMGAMISAQKDGMPPLRLAPVTRNGGRLRGIEYATPVPSAQVKTSVLFAGLLAEGETTVEETVRTRDHGELALRAFGAEVRRSRNRVTLKGGQPLTGISAFIPGDISTAAFFLCAAALYPESSLVLEHVLLNPTRAALLDVLTAMGARPGVLNLEEHHGELVGTIKSGHGVLKGARVFGALSAQLIDELPVLAAIAPYTAEGIEIRDAKELRVKESDRIAIVAANLRRMGAEVKEFEDGLSVPGGQRLHGAELNSAGDHRIAMAFAVAALRAEGETLIRDAECAAVSFPGFWESLESVVER